MIILRCLQVRLMMFLSLFFSTRTQASTWAPALVAVVSNDINFTRSARFHSWTKLNTAVASASPVPFRIFVHPSQDIRTARVLDDGPSIPVTREQSISFH